MDSAAAARVGAAFERMLLKDLLAGLNAGTQGLGDFATGALAQTIAEHDTGGFGSVLAKTLEYSSDDRS